MTTRLTLRRPDDWHLHVRDGAMLKASLPYSAGHFGRGIIMPNLVPPVRTVADALAYRARLLAALPEGSKFQPLMTAYMTDDTDPDEIERGFAEGVLTAVKIYPANATTYSAAGVTDFRKIRRVLARMEKIGMRLLIHGEEADPAIDVFDREAVFIDRHLAHWIKDFPGLKMVLEHISTEKAVAFVRDAAPQLGATITPYHLMLTRTDMLGWGIKPYFYCMPVLKRERDRLALREAATSGDPCFFLGTDSAPASCREKTRSRGRHPRPLQRARRDRELSPGVRGGRRAATSSRPSPRSTGRPITACRPTPTRSRSRPSPGPCPKRSPSKAPSAPSSTAAARPCAGRSCRRRRP